jgi:hypothetical protein
MRYPVEVLIRNEMEHVFGRTIVSSRDCIQLSHDVFQKTRCQLNPNTLRRFFGLVKATYPPSHSTLTILFYLLQAIACYKSGDPAAAGVLYDRINPSGFCFLRKKFSNILYLLLTEKLKRQPVKPSRQLNQLLEKTGYQRLRTIF